MTNDNKQIKLTKAQRRDLELFRSEPLEVDFRLGSLTAKPESKITPSVFNKFIDMGLIARQSDIPQIVSGFGRQQYRRFLYILTDAGRAALGVEPPAPAEPLVVGAEATVLDKHVEIVQRIEAWLRQQPELPRVHAVYLLSRLTAVTGERDAARATIDEALTAANEGRWNSVKSLLGGTP